MLNEISVSGDDSPKSSNPGGSGGTAGSGAGAGPSGVSDRPSPSGFRGGSAAARGILAGRGNNARAKPPAAAEEDELLGKPASGGIKPAAKVSLPAPKLDVQTFANSLTVGFFNSVAVATGHEHWLKDREEVLDFTGPLVAWLNELSPKQIKRLEKNLAPAMAVIGLANLLGPDVVQEMAIRKAERAASRNDEGKEGQGRQRTGKPAQAGANGMVNSGGRGGAADQGAAISIPVIPATHPLNDTLDV